MSLDLTALDGAMKQYYTNDRVENMVYDDNPLLALMPKMESFYGRNMEIPIIFGNPQGRSANFVRAQTRGLATSTKVSGFLLTRAKDYAVAYIDNETILASESNEGAFLQAATVEVDGAINAATRSLAIAQYRQGYGEIGQIGSISTNTITLLNVGDIVNFEVGMELDLSATISGALRAYGSSTNGLLVTNVNRNTGVITVSGAGVTDATNGIPTAAASDFIFVRGDHTSGALTKVAGLEAWVPATDPTSTAFFGVDRSVDVTRLGGLRLDGTALPVEEALIEGAALVAREGHKLSHFFMPYSQFSALEKALGSKVQYTDIEATAQVAFRGIQINGPRGPIQVVPDQNCPSNRMYGIAMQYWKLYSIGKAPRPIDTDGLQMLRQGAADGIEVRYGYYGNMACRAPGANINIQI